MADADHDAGLGEAGNLFRANGFRGDGENEIRKFRASCDEALEVGLVHRADEGRIVRALPRDREVRPFEMEAEEAGHALPCAASMPAAMAASLTATVSVTSVGRLAVVPNCAKVEQMVRMASTVGVVLSCAPPPPFTCRSTKPGHDHRAVGGNALGVGGGIGGDQPLHLAVRHDEGHAVMPFGPVEDAGAGESLLRAHSVWVTLLR